MATRLIEAQTIDKNVETRHHSAQALIDKSSIIFYKIASCSVNNVENAHLLLPRRVFLGAVRAQQQQQQELDRGGASVSAHKNNNQTTNNPSYAEVHVIVFTSTTSQSLLNL